MGLLSLLGIGGGGGLLSALAGGKASAPRAKGSTGLLSDTFKRSSTEGIHWVPVQRPDGSTFYASNDFLRDADGGYIRGSATTAQELAERFGARLPQSPAEVDMIGSAATRPLPFLPSGQFAGEYPSAGNFDRLTGLHNEAIAGAGYGEPTDDLAAGHFKTVMADGGIYLPGVQPHNVAHGPEYADYSQGIRLIRDTPPEGAAPVAPEPAPPARAAPTGGIAPQIRDGLVARFSGMEGIDQRTAQTLADAFLLNFEDESGLRPDIVEAAPNVHGTRGRGLYQLTGSRRNAYEARYGEDYGIDPQLDWLLYELQGPESRAWGNILQAAQTGDIGTTASRIVADFLRPARQHRDRRIAEYTGGRMPDLERGGSAAPSAAPLPSTGETEVAQAPVTSSGRGGLLSPTASTQSPEQPERRGLLGGWLNDDRRDFLMMALNGMTLNPNPGINAYVMGRMEDRRENKQAEREQTETEERRQRLASWLQSVDPELAEAYMAGAPEQAVMGAAMQRMQPQEAQPMTSIVTGEQAAALGLDPEFSYNVTQGPNGVEASRIGSGGFTTNIYGDQVVDPYIEGATDAAVDRHNAILTSAAEQSQLLGDLQTMAQLATQFETGFGANAMVTLGPLAERLGIEVEGLGAAEAYRAIQDRLAPRMRVPGSGATSDTEVRMFLNALPNLARSPEGNAIINQTLQDIASQQQSAAEMVRRAQRGEISWQEADAQIAEMGTPFEAFNEFNAGEAPSPAAGSPAPTGEPLATDGQIPTVTNQAEFDAIPPGGVFRDPQGNLRRKPE